MDNFIKKIFDGRKENDDLVHSQFIKFSRGKFENRAMLRAKNSDGKFTLATTSEYAKDIIMYLAEKLGDKRTKVTGALISTINLEGEFDFSDKKMAMGVKKYMIDKEVENFKKVEIKHTFDITEIIIPKDEKDFAKMREMAKRKGKIIRELDIDGKKLKKEMNFEA